MNAESWYVIVNPRAGSSKTIGKWNEAQTRLDALGLDYTTVLTNYKAHAQTLAYEAAERGWRRILAVGGDGSIHDVFNGVLRWCADNGHEPSEFTVGVAPIGSGNDWIRSFGIPDDVLSVVDLMAAESFGEEDVFLLESAGGKRTWIANGAGVGFDSHVCERVNRQKEAGHRNKMIYLNALRYTITHIKAIQLGIFADGKEMFSGDCYSVAMGVGTYSGGGMRQVPLAKPGDGLLDVMVVPKMSLKDVAKELPRLFNASIHESKRIVYFQCKELEIRPLNDASADVIEVDGEIEGTLPLKVSVTKTRIRVLKSAEPATKR
ncbi:MAG: YegS/Rv2252/BmrU family lipid kinase [Bacteroidales bacterium]|nr:YegS/Rv2252/BmrU family lipid kinase [Bacteroidales bacterium]